MFYAQFVLSKKGPLAKIWLAAHWEKKLSKQQIFETNVERAVDEIMQPKVKMALRTTGHLLLGIVRIYSRKAKYLLADCNEAFLKIKMAFRPGQIDIPEDNREAAINAITLPEMMADFDPNLPDFAELDNQFMSFNQSRLDEITLKEDLPSRSSFATDFCAMDDFGESSLGGSIYGDHNGDLLNDQPYLTNSSIERGRAASMTPGGRMSVSQLQNDLATPLPAGTMLDDNFGDFGDNDLFADNLGGDDGFFGDEKPLRDVDNISLSGDRPVSAAAPGEDEQHTMKNPEQDSSFALNPLEIVQKEVHKPSRKKRRLIVDDQKNITGEEMKAQMANYQDTLAEWELAPPNARLMHLKQCTVDRMLGQPSLDQNVIAPELQELFASATEYKLYNPKDVIDEEDNEEDDDLELVPADQLHDWHMNDESRPGTAHLTTIPEHDPVEVMDVAAPGEDDQLAIDLNQAPIDDEEMVSPKDRVKKRASKIDKSKEVEESFVDDDVEQTDVEDKRWTKRTQHILSNIKTKLDSAEEEVISFTDICKGATRKSAAQKFYTLLVLKKWQAIDVLQEKDGQFAEIFIKSGPNINQQQA